MKEKNSQPCSCWLHSTPVTKGKEQHSLISSIFFIIYKHRRQNVNLLQSDFSQVNLFSTQCTHVPFDYSIKDSSCQIPGICHLSHCLSVRLSACRSVCPLITTSPVRCPTLGRKKMRFLSREANDLVSISTLCKNIKVSPPAIGLGHVHVCMSVCEHVHASRVWPSVLLCNCVCIC